MLMLNTICFTFQKIKEYKQVVRNIVIMFDVKYEALKNSPSLA